MDCLILLQPYGGGWGLSYCWAAMTVIGHNLISNPSLDWTCHSTIPYLSCSAAAILASKMFAILYHVDRVDAVFMRPCSVEEASSVLPLLMQI